MQVTETQPTASSASSRCDRRRASSASASSRASTRSRTRSSSRASARARCRRPPQEGLRPLADGEVLRRPSRRPAATRSTIATSVRRRAEHQRSTEGQGPTSSASCRVRPTLPYAMSFEALPESRSPTWHGAEARASGDRGDAEALDKAIAGLVERKTLSLRGGAAGRRGRPRRRSTSSAAGRRAFEGGDGEGPTWCSARPASSRASRSSSTAPRPARARREGDLPGRLPDAELAGKDAVFEVKVKEVKGPVDAPRRRRLRREAGRREPREAAGAAEDQSRAAVRRRHPLQAEARPAGRARHQARLPAAAEDGRGRVRLDLATGAAGQGQPAACRRKTPRRPTSSSRPSTARSPSAACAWAWCWPRSAAPTTSR